MILDIRFTDKAPAQFQGVRMTTVSTSPDGWLVIHFYRYKELRLNIPLSTIVSIITTND